MVENARDMAGDTREKTIRIGLESEWRNYTLYDWLFVRLNSTANVRKACRKRRDRKICKFRIGGPLLDFSAKTKEGLGQLYFIIIAVVDCSRNQ